jgi:hypothetical protein
MPLKKCSNGHLYDSAVYDRCPFCPSADDSKTSTYSKYNPPEKDGGDAPTQILNNNGGEDGATVVLGNDGPYGEPKTTIHSMNQDGENSDCVRSRNNKKLVALFSTYSKTVNENGEIFKIYEGKTTVGREVGCKIVIKGDDEISAVHFTVLCRNIEGQPMRFYLKDNMSTNGTYVNGNIEDEQVEIKTSDVVKIGSTELTFIVLAN